MKFSLFFWAFFAIFAFANDFNATENNSSNTENNATIFEGSSTAEYFKKVCAHCHGDFGDASALSRSRLISELEPNEIEFAITSYQEKSYGEDYFKSIMLEKVGKLNKAEIKILSEYIAKLDEF